MEDLPIDPRLASLFKALDLIERLEADTDDVPVVEEVPEGYVSISEIKRAIGQIATELDQG